MWVVHADGSQAGNSGVKRAGILQRANPDPVKALAVDLVRAQGDRPDAGPRNSGCKGEGIVFARKSTGLDENLFEPGGLGLVLPAGGGKDPHLDESRLSELIRQRAPWFRNKVEEVAWSIGVCVT